MIGKGNSDRPGARKGDGGRAARLKAKLRENLKRRRLQAKGRAMTAPQPVRDAPPNSAGFMPEIASDKPKK